MATSMEECRILAERSRRFYQTAEDQIKRGYYDLAAFSLEQSLQLALKAMLLERGIAYPRIHSVRRLLELLVRVDEKFKDIVEELLERFSVELGALEDAYISSRYMPREYTRVEVERLKAVVNEVLRAVGGPACRGG